MRNRFENGWVIIKMQYDGLRKKYEALRTPCQALLKWD